MFESNFVPISKILPNPKQPRRRFKEESLRELAQSIQSHGVLQPVLVRPAKNREGFYEIIAGERRWRALQRTSVKEIPVIVHDIPDDQVLEIALIENIQREQLTPIEEGRSYQQLLEQHHYTQEQLAHRIGKDRSTIANMIRLLQLSSATQNDLEEGRLTIGHARALLSLTPTEEAQTRQQILKQCWSVRQTERHVKAQIQQHSTHTANSIKLAEDLSLQLQSLEESLQHILKTKVVITHKNGSGSIQIDYYSLDEFDRIYQQLGSLR